MNWKLSILLFSSLILVAIADTKVIGCADGGNSDDWLYTFFAPELSGGNPAFFLNHEVIDGTPDDFSKQNQEEWKNFLPLPATLTFDWNYLLYESSEQAIDSLVKYSETKKKHWLNNKTTQLTGILQLSNIKPALAYLKFAKSIEPIVARQYYWYDDLHAIPTSAETKALVCETHFTLEKNLFLKQRYGFNLMRLLYHLEKYDKAISFHKRLETLKISPSIAYRSEGYLAACYYKLGKYTEANLIYAEQLSAKVNQNSALWSFHIDEEADWNATLKKATKTEDKISLWFMLGYSRDPLRAMKEILKLNPNSDKLPVLMARAINIEEQHLIDLNQSSNDYGEELYSKLDFDSLGTMLPLYRFATETAENDKIVRKSFWYTAAGHLAYLRTDFKTAENLLRLAGNYHPSEEERIQLRLTSLIMLTDQTELNAEGEQRLAKELPWLMQLPTEKNSKSRFAASYIFTKLAKRYLEKEDRLKAELCSRQQGFTYSYSGFYSSKSRTEQMLTLMRKKQPTDWEKLLVSFYELKEANIVDWQTIQLVYQGKLEEALAKAQEPDHENNEFLYGDPFVIHPVDCHDCDHAAIQKKRWTKTDLIQELIRLNKEIDQKKNVAENAYRMGNAFYNISVYGNGRKMYLSQIANENEFSDGGLYVDVDEIPDLDDSALPNVYQMTFCKKYYQLAFDAEKRTERKAELCWMLAKTEQNDFLNGDVEIPEKLANKSPIDFIMGPHAKLFARNYSKTNYYKEVIKECGYFRTYVKRGRR